MRKKISILLAALLLPLTVLAQNSRTIHVETGGKLAEQISIEEKYTIEQLTVTGELNGTDFRLLRDMAGNDWQGNLTDGRLKKLDLSGAIIVEGGENYLETDMINIMEGYAVSSSKGFVYATEVNVLPQWGFVGCNNLNTIICPQTATAIGDYAFFSDEICSITFGDQLQTIGQNAFYHNIDLVELTLPASLTTIGENAFKFCSGLTAIYSYAAVPMPIPDNAFDVYDKATLYVPVGSLSAYKATDGWKKFQQIEESEKASGIPSTTTTPAPKEVYSLTGRRLPDSSTLPRGMYIVNNKKLIVK